MVPAIMAQCSSVPPNLAAILSDLAPVVREFTGTCASMPIAM
jgi:hypothetical protein